MKRIIAVLLCMLFVFAMPLVAFAEETEVVETEVVETTPEEPTEEKSEAQIEAELTTEKIVAYLQDNLEEIGVIITMILTVFYQVKKHASLNKSIGILNNNAVSVAESSSKTIGDALTNISIISGLVDGQKTEFANLLEEVRANEEEKQKLADTLASVEKYLATTKEANIALANEVAELLLLANIPTSRKDELYAAHLATVARIKALEESEVTDNDNTEA